MTLSFRPFFTQVFTRTADCNPLATSESKYCKDGIDVSNFLNLNSLENHDGFCLSYMFTNRDFMHGTLGLAWVGARDGEYMSPHNNV